MTFLGFFDEKLLSFFLFLYSVGTFADSWVIEDIRVTGLQRVSAGSVFASMPVSVGDEIDQREIQLVASQFLILVNSTI